MRRSDYQLHLKDAAGNPLDPAESLFRLGHVIQLTVAVPQILHSTFIDAGKPVPNAQTVKALIDTGCTRTSIDEKIVAALQIAPTGVTTKMTASGPGPAKLFPVQLIFPDLGGAGILIPQAMDCDIHGQGLGALIGRDILRHFVMIYDGVRGRVTLIN